MKTVYLAGPITGCNYEGATSWRAFAQSAFPKSIRGISPMRDKGHLAGEKNISCHGYEGIPLSSEKGILLRDFYDCTNSDAVLVNLVGAKIISVGTVMEIAWAYQARNPLVVAMEKGNIHEHALLLPACGIIVPTLSEAVRFVISILYPHSE